MIRLVNLAAGICLVLVMAASMLLFVAAAADAGTRPPPGYNLVVCPRPVVPKHHGHHGHGHPKPICWTVTP